MTIQQMLNTVKKFERDMQKVVSQTFADNRAVIRKLQQDQLLLGRDSKGEPLKPDYDKDPFFKTKEGRDKYILMKGELENQHNALIRYNLFPRKPYLTPNLYVTGKFHRSLKVDVNGNSYRISSTWSRGKNIEKKYPTALGLSPQALKEVMDARIKADLNDRWQELLHSVK